MALFSLSLYADTPYLLLVLFCFCCCLGSHFLISTRVSKERHSKSSWGEIDVERPPTRCHKLCQKTFNDCFMFINVSLIEYYWISRHIPYVCLFNFNRHPMEGLISVLELRGSLLRRALRVFSSLMLPTMCHSILRNIAFISAACRSHPPPWILRACQTTRIWRHIVILYYMVVKGDHLQLVPKGTYRLAPHGIPTLALTWFMAQMNKLISLGFAIIKNHFVPIRKICYIFLNYIPK